MDKRNNNFKIAIIGVYPPPYGGISVHVQRMHHYLQERNIEHTIYTNTQTREADLVHIGNRKKWWLKYFFTAKENIIHFHSMVWRERVLIGMMGLCGKNVILTIHSEDLNTQINQNNWIKKKILIWALRNIKIFIVVNLEIKNLLVSLGIKPKKLEYVPAYIPPLIKDEEITEISQKIWDFIDSHNPIISASASAIVFYKGQDLYGIDMCIDLCTNLRQNCPKIGFVVCLPDIGDYEYFNKMKQKIKKKRLEDNFLFQTKPCQMYPIIMKSDVFVRPTNTDGDSVSVREALHFSVPTVVSDAVPRPAGTILFKNRDIADFTSKVTYVLDNYESHKKKVEITKNENNFEKIIKVYKKF